MLSNVGQASSLPVKKQKHSSPTRIRAKKRRGMLLVVVLVVVMMLSLAAYTYVMLMRSHRESATLTNQQVQAKLMVDSGIDYLRIYLSQPADMQAGMGGKYNNPSFKQLPIIDDPDPQFRGYATIVAPALDDEANLAGVRYGLEDESTRLNLNMLIAFEKMGIGSQVETASAINSAVSQLGGTATSDTGNTGTGNTGTGNTGAGNTGTGNSSPGDSTTLPSGTTGSSSSNPATGNASSGSSAGTAGSGSANAPSATDSAARNLLMALPNMTVDVADAILDYLDEDDEVRDYGCERAYYTSLDPPYEPKNGALDTVEELLRVRGVTPELLFGADTNRNGQIDPNEAAGMAFPGGALPLGQAGGGATGFGDGSGNLGAATGSLDRGWAAYLTLHSREKNLTPEGMPRVYLNNPDLNVLYEELSAVLPQEWATFIVAYRQGGPFSGRADANNPPQSANGHTIDFNIKSKTTFTQALDLIGAQTQIKFAGEQKATVVKGPFGDDLGAMNVYMPILMDYVTVNPALSVPGRININQAPAAVLRGIPGITPEQVDQILSLREAELTEEQPNRRHETWLLTSAVVSLTEMKLLQPFICSGGHVYRAQVVGYFQNGEAAARAEAIFDATGPLPRVVLWRDMSHLGRGYALETLGVDYAE